MTAREVKKWLLEQSIRVIDSWLEDCIGYFLSEQRDISLTTLCKNVYEQWILADLADVGIPCLPTLEENRYLSGTYVLQVQSAIDTGSAAYNQLQEIYKSHTEVLQKDAWQQETSTRLLKLVLSDGINIVEAIESRPIRCFNTNLIPGTKLSLQGHIYVLKGNILLLREDNVSIIGGEVEALLESNSRVNILLKSLGLRPEQNPFKDKSVHATLILTEQNNNAVKQQKAVENVQGIADAMSEMEADQIIAELDINQVCGVDKTAFTELKDDSFFGENEFKCLGQFTTL